MAIIKAISSKAGIATALDYVMKEEKTDRKLISGLHCEPETVKNEMQATKELWDKTDGRTYKHFVQSYHEDEKITPEQAHKNAIELAEKTKAWTGYEVLIATHIDRGHIHSHFIVNSVNYENGHKLQWSKQDLVDIKERCNQQSQQQGLHLPEKGKTFEGAELEDMTTYNKDKYYLLKHAEIGRVKSYVLDTAVAVMLAKQNATDKDDFIARMSEQGYGTSWQGSRKNITFIDKNGNKVRNSNLEKTFHVNLSKEALEHEFEQNRSRTGSYTTGTKKPERTTSRNEQTEQNRVGKQLTERSIDRIERELREITESVKARTSKGRAEQEERRRIEQSTHQRTDKERRNFEKQQRNTSTSYIDRDWEFER